MEDPKLVKEFRKLVDGARKQGFSEATIRESMHEASPKAKWHERAYLSIVESSSISFGFTVVMLVILFSSFINSAFLVPFLLFLPGAILYYFAISAFKHHSGSKFFMTLVVSVLLSVAAVIIKNLYNALLANIQVRYDELLEMADAARAFGADIPNLPALPLPADVNLPLLILALFFAYNISPIVAFIKDNIKFEKK